MNDAGQFTIEPCTSAAQPGWLELRCALWPDSDRDELAAEMATFVAQPDRYAQFVAYAPGRRAIGFAEASVRTDWVNGTTTSPVAFLEGLYVEPDSRRRGVARALVAAVLGWARARGLREIASDAAIDNARSHALHRALGFDETERVVYFRRSID